MQITLDLFVTIPELILHIYVFIYVSADNILCTESVIVLKTYLAS